MRFTPTTFRPLFGRVLAVIVGVVVLLGLVGLVIASDPAVLVRYVWAPLFIGVGAFALFWFPSIAVA